MTQLKKDWNLNSEAFRRFLNWLDGGASSDGQSYLEMRRRLVRYFDQRNCSTADDLADETLNRVARKLEEKGAITDVSPAHYCYIVAKFVFLEYLRRAEHVQTSLDERLEGGSSFARLEVSDGVDPQLETKEKLLECLEKCLGKLPTDEQALIVEYYRGAQDAKIELRANQAERLGVSLNALSIRACRIRQKLEECVRSCCGDT